VPADRNRVAVASPPFVPTIDLDLDRVACDIAVVGEGNEEVFTEVVLPRYLLNDVIVIFKQGAQRVHGSLSYAPPFRDLRHTTLL
jgi:hypothetical protein